MVTMESKKTNQQNNKLWKILMIVFLAGAIICGTVFGVQSYRKHQAQKQLEELAQQTNQTPEKEEVVASTQESQTASTEPSVSAEPDPLEVLAEMGVPVPEKEIDFEDLQVNTNEHIYAWVYIPDTKIDYPILQHPDNNLYYLERNLDGSKGYPGCIYTEDYNSKDFTDPNTVLYGHNMKNGTMFAGLHKYEDMQYLEEHPYVYVYTPDELLVYEIFAAYEYSNAHLLLNWDLTNEAFYKQYLEEIKEVRSMTYNYREDVEVTTEDKILTMSTCIANKPNNRYLVQGVLINED